MNTTELEPKAFFRFFEEISRIPHGSYNTDGIRDYLIKFAEDRGLEHWSDSAGNVVISKPASPGYEDQEGVIIQGHMDMVAVKTADCFKDMKKDPLDLVVDGDLLYAEGTSLGADDGIAVCYGLAFLDSDSIPHPPLEVVLTVDEEVGMEGAKVLDVSRLKGTRVINIDIITEGVFITGCTGAARIESVVETPRKKKTGAAYSLKVCGLLGGHAGAVIKLGRANANRMMGRVLRALSELTPAYAYYLEGGNADNAIARECDVRFIADPGKEAELAALAERLTTDFQKEYSGKDPDICVEFAALGEVTENCIEPEALKKIEDLLRIIPDGLQAMNGDIPDLPQISINNGIAVLKEDTFSLTVSLRGALESEWEDLTDRVARIAELCG
ncbi:MAG: M20/M25/M40 family metallo-hydrolase, partial [Lachnospiraceae bacterium]|nr:M20/M25/M40 family metallo-hydrolase [Lachnospiraceae bacterium]